jgi:hypothetical protein
MKIIEAPTTPVVLGPTRVEMLYELWRESIGARGGWWISLRKEQWHAARELVRYGYAEFKRCAMCVSEVDYSYEARITQMGIDRLEAPMLLCKHELGPIRPERIRKTKLRRVK